MDSDSNYVEKDKYYDVVCSVYEEKGTNNCCDVRVNSYLICGGFVTKDKAIEYIDTHDCSIYDHYCSKGQYPCIEIEEHDENGCVLSVVTVD